MSKDFRFQKDEHDYDDDEYPTMLKQKGKAGLTAKKTKAHIAQKKRASKCLTEVRAKGSIENSLSQF
ncbi:hypothetical protein ISG33_16670 [Glaciecola sp. MH2013]|uniref:hypothetical protein n=1 Tax=Glaciecola sp. MH2013 TaxID=2785524 RepID=UPI0018A1201A|nr:hypothetical protein [Glaciecola sp. MH2013]MBF7075037.1 hypothetical protein [Glaciecola sp. MH2013]